MSQAPIESHGASSRTTNRFSPAVEESPRHGAGRSSCSQLEEEQSFDRHKLLWVHADGVANSTFILYVLHCSASSASRFPVNINSFNILPTPGPIMFPGALVLLVLLSGSSLGADELAPCFAPICYVGEPCAHRLPTCFLWIRGAVLGYLDVTLRRYE